MGNRRVVRQVLAGGALATVLACGGGDGGATAPTEPLPEGPPTWTIAKVAGDAQVAPWAGVLPDSLVVRVTDRRGQPVRTSVQWTAIPGGGRVHGRSHQTDHAGVVAATWTLGAVRGPQAVVATVDGGPSVTFGATAVDGTQPVFTHPIVPLDRVAYIGALGNVAPPGHTIPSDHIYFYMSDNRQCPCPLPPKVPVVAPAGGVIETINRGATWVPDDDIFIRVAPHVVVYVIHVLLPAELRVGQRIEAGQSLGTTSGGLYAVDLGVINYQRPNPGFVRPERYFDRILYADRPLTYYAEPLRSAHYAKVFRAGADKDGRVDYDVPGRLSGGWFVEGTPIGDPGGEAGWAKQLYFLYANYDPALPLVSVGGTLATGAGVWEPVGGPDFADVTPATGLVRYTLHTRGGPHRGDAIGTLLVEMLAADSLRVQALPGDTTARAFTGAAVRYTR